MYRPSPLLAPVLYVPGLIFGVIVRARNLSYSYGLLNSHRLPRPVISIGNLTLGGGGKTPLLIYLARMLAMLGHTPALLSRGYGRRNPTKSHIVPPGCDVSCPAREHGDEPALIRRHVPAIWLGISSDRRTAGRRMIEEQTGLVFLLDDGFQHRQLQRDLDLVIIDCSQPLLGNRMFPCGNLREPVSSLGRCHAIILNGALSTTDARALEEALHNMPFHGRVFSCVQRIESLVPFEAWQSQTLTPAKCPRGYLAAALANPERFRSDVEALGVHVAGSHFLRDHRSLTENDWRICTASALENGAQAVIISEKDAVKVERPPAFPVLVAVQSVHISSPAEFERMVVEVIRSEADRT